jgi:hypothetical protein
MEENGRMRSTVARRLSTLASFYRYCEQEGLVERNPAANVRRPKVDYESRTLGLDRNELGAFLVQAGLGSARDHALASLLALNGLRISEALGADIDTLEFERGHRTLKILRKGASTPSFRWCQGRRGRLTSTLVSGRRVRSSSVPRASGWTVTPPTERSSAWPGGPGSPSASARTACATASSPLTTSFDAGVPLRDVQEAASYADPRTTMRCDRGRGSLDRHATYIVATFLAGASR